MQPVSGRYGRKPPHLARSFFSFGIPTKDWSVVILPHLSQGHTPNAKSNRQHARSLLFLRIMAMPEIQPWGGIHVVTETKRRNSAFSGAVSDSRFHEDRLRSALPKDDCALCVDSRESLRE